MGLLSRLTKKHDDGDNITRTASKDQKTYGTVQQDGGNNNDGASDSSSVEVQAGVKKVEAISLAWSRQALYLAYAGVFLMAFATSLEVQTTSLLGAFATSSFQKHSLLSTIGIVQSVLMAVVKPPMAKIADIFGRPEAFTISIIIYLAGYVQLAASNNVRTYAAAQIFYSAGSTGLQLLQQVFVADTTDLLNRALLSSLPDTPFLATVWIGPEISGSLLKRAGWRWGYAIWCFVLPVACAPLLVSLYWNQRKAKKMGILKRKEGDGGDTGKRGVVGMASELFWELDLMGILIFTAALTLLLIPLTLAAGASDKWKNPSLIAMMVVGGICLLALPFFETSSVLAPKPLLSLRLLRNRTVIGGCGIAFFYFMAFYLSVFPYFFSYLCVVKNYSAVAAGHITQTFSFCSTVSSIVVSLLIKYAYHRYRIFIIIGASIYILGLGLMIRYRSESSNTVQIVLCQIVIGLGGGMLNVPAQLGVQAAVPHADVGAATALFLTVLSVGGAVGSAVSGAIWGPNLKTKLTAYLPDDAKQNATAIFGSFVVAQSFAVGTPERVAINRAYEETMKTLLIVATCAAVPILFFAACMKEFKLDLMDQRVKGTVIGSGDKKIGGGGGGGDGEFPRVERDTASDVEGATVASPANMNTATAAEARNIDGSLKADGLA